MYKERVKREGKEAIFSLFPLGVIYECSMFDSPFQVSILSFRIHVHIHVLENGHLFPISPFFLGLKENDNQI